MKIISSLVAASILAASVLAAGCGSSNSDGAGGGAAASTSAGSGSSDVACTFSQGMSMSCIQYANLMQAQIDGIKQSCSAQPSGMVVDACPTDKLLGCCEQMTGGIDTSTCYYEAMGLTADSLKMACMMAMGTWSDTP